MSPEKITFIAVTGLFILIFMIFVARRLPKKLKKDKYKRQWRNLQAKCANKEMWREAIIEADDLLASALKKRRIKGSTMGERMVESQKIFTDNDAVWYGHKLRLKIDANPELKLNKDDVKRALMGIGQGLKDLGAFK